MGRLLLLLLLLLLLAAGGLAACGGDGPDTASVDVFLSEWEVSPEAGSTPAGAVRFTTTNGGQFVHQLLIIRTETSAADLPTTPDGRIDESRADVLGKVDNVAPGGIERRTFTLQPGHYALACNIADETGGDVISHYQKGMRADFSVVAGD